MFETMKKIIIKMIVSVETGMGPNYVFNSTKEMADYSRAYLNAYYALEELFPIALTILAIVTAIVSIMAIKAVWELFDAKED